MHRSLRVLNVQPAVLNLIMPKKPHLKNTKPKSQTKYGTHWIRTSTFCFKNNYVLLLSKLISGKLDSCLDIETGEMMILVKNHQSHRDIRILE
jgi:hypothetical protein